MKDWPKLWQTSLNMHCGHDDSPSQMNVNRIHRAGKDRCIQFFKLGYAVAEGNDLGRANKGTDQAERRQKSKDDWTYNMYNVPPDISKWHASPKHTHTRTWTHTPKIFLGTLSLSGDINLSKTVYCLLKIIIWSGNKTRIEKEMIESTLGREVEKTRKKRNF